MIDRLTSPFKRRFRKYADRVNGFVTPVHDAVSNLMGRLPIPKDNASGEGSADGASKPAKGIFARLSSFKQSLKEMSDFQKLILLTIAICLPAGILLSTILVALVKKERKK